jgi:hypothetical protein
MIVPPAAALSVLTAMATDQDFVRLLVNIFGFSGHMYYSETSSEVNSINIEGDSSSVETITPRRMIVTPCLTPMASCHSSKLPPPTPISIFFPSAPDTHNNHTPSETWVETGPWIMTSIQCMGWNTEYIPLRLPQYHLIHFLVWLVFGLHCTILRTSSKASQLAIT